MKKLMAIFLCLVMCIVFVGCENEKESLIFEDFGIEVQMQIDETISVSQDNNTILVSNIKDNDAIGVISVDKQNDKNINEIYDTCISGNGEKSKTELSDKLIFVEITNKVDSVVLGERIDKIYGFIFYDESIGAVLYGRFFQNSERDYVMNLAKSIEVVKI